MSKNENVAPPILSDNSDIEKVGKPSEEYTRIFTSSIISKQDCEIFEDLILKPHLIIDGEYYFFFPKEVKKELNDSLTKTLNKYDYMFEPIKADLIKYSKKPQIEEFKEDLGFFLNLKREIYFYWYPEEKKECNKAKKIAFLLSQLNSKKNNTNNESNDIYITVFNKNNEKFTNDDDRMFQMISISLSLNSIYDDNVVIMELINKIEKIKKEIYKTSDEKKIKIYITYLISIVERKISHIKNTYKVDLLNKEAKMTLYKIFDEINLLALRFTIEGQSRKKFFYDIEFEYIKIIKDNEREKQALIENGNLDSFIEAFKTEFESTKNFILPINDEDDTEITYENNNIFVKKCLLNIKELKKSKYDREDQINDIQNKRLINSLESATKFVSTLNNTDNGDKTKTTEAKDTNDSIDKNLLNKTLENIGEIANICNELKTSSMKINRINTKEIDTQLKYWKKLKNISLLLNKIENIRNKEESFKGLIITQKFIDDDDTFLVKTFN